MLRIGLFLLMATTAMAQEKATVGIGTNGGMGTGTVVARDGKLAYILTNKHVISSSDKRIWVIHDRKRYEAKFVKADPNVDLALAVLELDIEPVQLADREPKEGEFVKHFGRATGPQEGKMTGWTNFATSDGVVMDSDIFSVAGDSGSGMFNADGKLVAVHYGRKGDPDGDTVALGVRLTRIREFLKGVGK